MWDAWTEDLGDVDGEGDASRTNSTPEFKCLAFVEPTMNRIRNLINYGGLNDDEILTVIDPYELAAEYMIRGVNTERWIRFVSRNIREGRI